jgi:hypothetical protein
MPADQIPMRHANGMMGGPAARCATGCVAIFLCAATLSACGSSGTSTTATRAEFVARANAICASSEKKASQLKAPTSAANLLPFAEQARSIVDELLTQLEGVTPPSGSRAAYGRFLATAGRETQEIGRLVTALHSHDVNGAKAALGALNSNASNAEAKALGLTECARTATR